MSEIRELSPSDWAILHDLLDTASEQFSNHGCNDFEIDDTPEHRDLLRRAEKECGDPDCQDEEPQVYGGKLLTQDWFLMAYFKAYAGKKAGLRDA